jgi:hypothetical protein
MATPLAYFKNLVDESGTTLNARKVDDTVLLDLALRECAADRKKAPWLTKLKTLLLGTHVWDVVPSFVTDAPDLYFVYQYDNKRTRAAVLFGLTPRVETIIFTKEEPYPNRVINNPATIASILHDVPMLNSVTLPMPKKASEWTLAEEADPRLRAGCRGLSVIFSGTPGTRAASQTAVAQVMVLFATYARREHSSFPSIADTVVGMSGGLAVYATWAYEERTRAQKYLDAEKEAGHRTPYTASELLEGNDDRFPTMGPPGPLTMLMALGVTGTLALYTWYHNTQNSRRPTDKYSTLQINGLTTEDRLDRLFGPGSAAEVERIRARAGRVPAKPAERPQQMLTPRKAASPSASQRTFSPSPTRKPRRR